MKISGAGFVRGSVAIVQRGGCSFLEIGRAAQLYGASGCIIVNNEGGVLNGRLGTPEEVRFSIDFDCFTTDLRLICD